jgi:hypothetical protein
MSDFGNTAKHKARKEHRCEWCGEVILKDTMFWQFTGRWEGEFQNWRMHEECYAASTKDRFTMEDGFEPFGQKRGLDEPK